MADTSKTSSDERIKSKTRMRRERRMHKYTTTMHREVTLSAVITPVLPSPSTCHLHPQLPAQVRDLSSANLDH